MLLEKKETHPEHLKWTVSPLQFHCGTQLWSHTHRSPECQCCPREHPTFPLLSHDQSMPLRLSHCHHLLWWLHVHLENLTHWRSRSLFQQGHTEGHKASWKMHLHHHKLSSCCACCLILKDLKHIVVGSVDCKFTYGIWLDSRIVRLSYETVILNPATFGLFHFFDKRWLDVYDYCTWSVGFLFYFNCHSGNIHSSWLCASDYWHWCTSPVTWVSESINHSYGMHDD